MAFFIDNFDAITWAWLALAAPIFVALQFVIAPFGRHTNKDVGILVNNRMAWVLMESVSFFIVLTLVIMGSQPTSYISWAIVALWLAHYFNRAFIYPLRQKNRKGQIPLIILVLAIIFNLINATLNGYYLGFLGKYDSSIFLQWNFWVGLSLFFGGAFVNIKSDNMLLALRKPGESDYKIPQGFLFKYISCPNHLGEIIEWVGFAFITWNWASLSFAVWTFANLAPRAMAHHKWYQSHFSDYPKNRRALIPFL